MLQTAGQLWEPVPQLSTRRRAASQPNVQRSAYLTSGGRGAEHARRASARADSIAFPARLHSERTLAAFLLGASEKFPIVIPRSRRLTATFAE